MEKNKANAHGLITLAALAIAFRLLFTIGVDMPYLDNAGWLSALISAALFAPVILAIRALRAGHDDGITALRMTIGAISTKIVALLLLISLVLDASCMCVALSDSAQHYSFGRISNYILVALPIAALIPTSIADVSTLGSFARLALRLCVFLLIIIFVPHVSQLHASWLSPILGNGIATLSRGGLRLSGIYAPLIALNLLPACDKRVPSRALMFGAQVGCLITIIISSFVPPMPEFIGTGRMYRLDLLLINQINASSLYLPILIFWFVGFFVLLAIDACLAVHMLRVIFPNMRPIVAAIFTLVATLALTFTHLSSQDALELLDIYRYIVLAPISLIIGLIAFIKRKRGVKYA